MTKRLRIKGGVAAIWDEPGSGDLNAPFTDPAGNLTAIGFHSEFDYYNRAASGSTTISHASVAADPGTTTSSFVVSYNAYTDVTWDLLTHGLGYVPRFLVAVDGVEVPNGMPIQENAYGGIRTITVLATTTKIQLREHGVPSVAALPALSKTYNIVVFKAPAADPLQPAAWIKPTLVVLGYGKVRSDQISMRQAVVGDTSPYYLPIARCADINNGQIRFVTADGTLFDTGANGGLAQYKGSFQGQIGLPIVA